MILQTKSLDGDDRGAMAIDQNKTIKRFEVEVTRNTIVIMTQSEYEAYLENQNQNQNQNQDNE